MIVWRISSHIEASVHPAVSNIWADGRVLDKATDHGELWVEHSNGNASLVLLVPGLTHQGSQGVEDELVLVGAHGNGALGQLGVPEVARLEDWVEDDVAHGEVDFQGHGRGPGEDGDWLGRGAVLDPEFNVEDRFFASDFDALSLSHSEQGAWVLWVDGESHVAFVSADCFEFWEDGHDVFAEDR